jgi:hypothetical protein
MPMFVERLVSFDEMTSFRGQASWAKMMSNKHWVMLDRKFLAESNALAYYGTG